MAERQVRIHPLAAAEAEGAHAWSLARSAKAAALFLDYLDSGPISQRSYLRNIKRRHEAHFNALRKTGNSVSQVNKSIKVAKAVSTYAFDSEYVTSNIMQRYPRLQCVDGERKTNRGVFTEVELQAIFECATPFELALVATLSISGPRPGEIYALDWSAVYLNAEKPYFRIERTWCSKGFRFYPPKTAAGQRTVPISAWLADVLRAHRARSVGWGLVFPSEAGTRQWRGRLQRLPSHRTRARNAKASASA